MILAILQARISSSRLPKKVIRPILGKEMILHQVDRIQRSRLIDKLVVATSDIGEDREVVELCHKNSVEVFTGSLNDVLDRYYNCAKLYNPQHIVRLTADCPLADWEVIDKTIRHHLEGKFDYTANNMPPTYPDGLDVEVVTNSVLSEAFSEAKKDSQREHVTLYIKDNYDKFKMGSVCNNNDTSHLRWTVDELEDFILVDRIYNELYPKNSGFLMDDILTLFDRMPELKEINCHIKRDEGLKRSLEREG